MKKPYSSLSLTAALLFSVTAYATNVSVVGLFSDKAIVTINGSKQKLIRAGEKTPEGVRLISADSNQAVLEIDGKQQTLSLGQGVSTGGVQDSDGKASATLTADAQGHFLTTGSINGNPTRFLVDTGASAISMSGAEAKRLGISYLNGERGFSSTANGVSRVYRVSLNTVKVGDISINGVEGIVHESAMPFVLLGMSFLNRVNMKREGDSMVLTKRF
ncbi:MAG: TIGR02281 family clan AA aspartic protease [Sulfuricella denitrificans]|nr:TIGR02281 family clan AA aspartic protease [Sulfuricella denitrificans]